MSKQISRGTAPSIKAIDKYWKQRILSEPDWCSILGDLSFEVILEDGGGGCYACGVGCKPERAHIVPHGLGGSMDVDNLFLLCTECHKLNPDTIYPDMFFSYVRNTESHITKLFKEFAIISKLYEEASSKDKESFDKVNHHTDHNFMAQSVVDLIRETPQALGANGRWTDQTKSVVIWKNCVAVGKTVTPSKQHIEPHVQ